MFRADLIKLTARLLPALVLACPSCAPREREEGRTVAVLEKPLTVSAVYDATLGARHVEVITAQYAGSAVVSEVAPEGAEVQPGQVLVRFDDAQARRDFYRIQRDAELARLELETLERATLPMELESLGLQLEEARSAHAAERDFMEDCRALVRDKLMSDQELALQQEKVERMAKSLHKAERECELVRTYTHSSRLERARATYVAAAQELQMASQQVANCSVKAPSAGAVVYLPLNIGTEYRTVRVGDSLHRNQAFLALPDLSDWVATCHIPEVELGRVSVGNAATVTPLAYPGLTLTARVESVSAIAQEVPGSGNWLKHFRVTLAVAIDPAQRAGLRSGLSAQVRIVSYHAPKALVIPRAAVRLDEAGAYVLRKTWKGVARQSVQTGQRSLAEAEVLEGLAAGDKVLLE